MDCAAVGRPAKPTIDLSGLGYLDTWKAIRRLSRQLPRRPTCTLLVHSIHRECFPVGKR